MGGIIPARQLFVLIQPSLGQIKRFLADNRRYHNGNPVLGRSNLLALA
jgi:hypothetical protein